MQAIVFAELLLFISTAMGYDDCHSDNGYCLFIRCPFPFIAFCVAATVYRYLFSMRPSIAPNDEFIASFVLHVRDKAVDFIFICKFYYAAAAGDRATVVKLYRKLGMIGNERSTRTPQTNSSNQSHTIIVRTKKNVAHILFGLLPKADACAWHCFALSRLETAYHEFATALKMVARVYVAMGDNHRNNVETDTRRHSLAFERVASVAFQSGCAHSSRRQAKRRLIDF